jgi:signal transduction histidine kinase
MVPIRALLYLGAVWLLAIVPVRAWAEQPVDYLRDVKPLLREKCWSCHGALKQQAGLRLDTAASIRQGADSGAVVLPEDAAASPLIERVTDDDKAVRMPLEGTPLTEAEVELLKAWIAAGAAGPDDEQPEPDPREHWAFRPPQRPPVPAREDAGWGRNPIDAFVAAEHERHGLTPRPPTDRATLLRRVYLNLIGLPPSRDELQAFLADDSPDAYERVVDKLLDSPQYGERWGRHWMDVWRYSDWYGRRSVPDVWNSAPQIWRWRDWIVRSLNEGKGYDRMIAEVWFASVADADSLRVTLTALAEAVHAATDMAAVQVLTLHDDGPLLRVIGRAGLAEDPEYIERLLECRRRGADLQMLRAVEERRPIVIPGRKAMIMADPRWEPLYPYIAELDWDALAAVPMFVRNRAVGILVVFYPGGRAPDAQSLEFLTAMADQAAMAVDYQALRAESKDRARRDERERIARDLHDSVVQQVFSMRLQARALDDHCRAAEGDLDEGRVGQAVAQMLTLSRNTLADLRDLIFELRPADLVEHGLAEALRVHAAAIEARSGLAVHVECAPAELDLSTDAQEDLYRIVQEALHNVVKHAQAHSARVTIGEDSERGVVTVEVSDDGRGMAGTPEGRGRLGLVSMRQRAARWGADLRIEAAGERGVRLSVALPSQSGGAHSAQGKGGSGDDQSICA